MVGTTSTLWLKRWRTPWEISPELSWSPASLSPSSTWQQTLPSTQRSMCLKSLVLRQWLWWVLFTPHQPSETWIPHFADLCWKALRPIRLPHPCGCGSLHLWRGQWHSSHFFQVIVVFKQQIYAMIEFRGMRGKNPPQCFLKNSLISSHRLFYAGACEKQMPEVLSMIQVDMKFSNQYQN